MEGRVTAYHFWSPTCQPCKIIKPAIEDLKEEFSNIEWVSVNTHADTSSLANVYQVHAVPTIVVVVRDNSGKIVNVDKHSGTTMQHYYRIIRNAIRLSSM